MKHIVLAPQLEHSLLSAILEGTIAPSTLSAEELSKDGKAALKSIKYLIKHGAETPLKSSAVQFTATKIFGAGRASSRRYLRTLGKVDVESDAQAIIKAARSKEALVSLINEASEQLSEGGLNRHRLSHLIGKESWGIGRIPTIADTIKNGFPKPPEGISLPSLPTISKALHGLSGLWIVGGEPGVGKSTFCWQLAMEVAKEIEVIVYDLDGTGLDYFIDNTLKILGSKKRVRRLMQRFHFKEDLNDLDNDLSLLKPPTLILVDSMQTVPINVTHRRNSLDKWIVEFKQVAKRGYPVVLVSEVPRGAYTEAYLGGYKETGAIEYAGSACIRLMGDIEEEDEPIEFHLMKNKHYKKKGHFVNLERVKGKDYWFKEAEIV